MNINLRIFLGIGLFFIIFLILVFFYLRPKGFLVGQCKYFVSSESGSLRIRPYNDGKIKKFLENFSICNGNTKKINIVFTDQPQMLPIAGAIIKDTNSPVDIAFANVYDSDGGKITTLKIYVDPAAKEHLNINDSNTFSLVLISALIRFPDYDKTNWVKTQPRVLELIERYPTLDEVGIYLEVVQK